MLRVCIVVQVCIDYKVTHFWQGGYGVTFQSSILLPVTTVEANILDSWLQLKIAFVEVGFDFLEKFHIVAYGNHASNPMAFMCDGFIFRQITFFNC